MAAEEDLKDFDPAAPIHRGWDTYRYAQKEADVGPATETSLERAMRLRQEFLDALKECGATAAQGFSLSEGGSTPASQVLQIRALRPWCRLTCETLGSGPQHRAHRMSSGCKRSPTISHSHRRIVNARVDTRHMRTLPVHVAAWCDNVGDEVRLLWLTQAT